MKVVIASDKFKGSLSSGQVADAIEEGILSAIPDCEVKKLFVADGGDGTAEAMVASTGGKREKVKTVDPLGRPVEAWFGVVDSDTAVLDVATASGIARLKPSELNPLDSSTFGTGLILKAALERGFRKFLIGAGGSATNDAATGMLVALGFRFLDRNGREIAPCGRNLRHIAAIDRSGISDALADCSFTILCDVDASFCGSRGAVALFAPQKGANKEDMSLLEKGMRSFAEVIKKETGRSVQNQSYAGAAGGTGGSLWALLGARLTPGVYTLLKTIRFEQALADADLVVTGEGRMDKLTLLGKAPYGVCGEAAWNGKPTIAFVGSVDDCELLNEYGFLSVYPIMPGPAALTEAMSPEFAYRNLRRAASQVFRTLLINLSAK